MRALLFHEPWSIGIIGCRARDTDADLALVEEALMSIYSPGDTLVSGGCVKGADRFAEVLAARLGAPLTLHLPDKTALDQRLLERNPRAAYAQINYDRNTLVARDSVNALIACVAPDRKGGTEDTIKKWARMHPQGELILV